MLKYPVHMSKYAAHVKISGNVFGTRNTLKYPVHMLKYPVHAL